MITLECTSDVLAMKLHEHVSNSFRTESITKYTLTTMNTRLRSNTKGYGGKTH
jgi:hypothetical protein